MAYGGTVEYPRIASRAIRDAFRFTGRSTRTEVVVYYLATILISLVLGFIPSAALDFGQSLLTMQVVHLLLIIPIPALLVRRFHDQDRTGRWLWLAAFAFLLWGARTIVTWTQGIETRVEFDEATWPLDWIATIASIVTILLVILPGTIGSNRFGPDPRGRD